MTDFNYLVHGSVIFAVGLLVGLIGALISTHGTRKELKRLRKQVGELESHDVSAPAAASAPVKTAVAATTATVATAVAAKHVDHSIEPEPVTKIEPVKKIEAVNEIAEDFAHDNEADAFDHTEVKIATPKPQPDRFSPPSLGGGSSTDLPVDEEDIDQPEHKTIDRPAPDSDLDRPRPKISINESDTHSQNQRANVVVPPRESEAASMPRPSLTPAAATLASAGSHNETPNLNLQVDRDNDIHGRIEPSLGSTNMQPRSVPTELRADAPVDHTVQDSSAEPREKTIWDSHDEIVPAEAPTPVTDTNLPPINDDGTVGFQAPGNGAEGDAQAEEQDDESKKRSLRKALLTGGTLMGVDND